MHPEGKYVVDIDKGIDINLCLPGARVALRNDSYALHLLLPTKVRFSVELEFSAIWEVGALDNMSGGVA